VAAVDTCDWRKKISIFKGVALVERDVLVRLASSYFSL
jgi:hypothetical protein